VGVALHCKLIINTSQIPKYHFPSVAPNIYVTDFSVFKGMHKNGATSCLSHIICTIKELEPAREALHHIVREGLGDEVHCFVVSSRSLPTVALRQRGVGELVLERCRPLRHVYAHHHLGPD